ncbi:helix-turn-helix domain-containing protein [Oceanomicrobium pacificus]|uniref:Helix-turn-helix domain-containing protein n=1 Tax=Oceanomicrobium pacificus TaxID=2692916 RepID=A0A6B0TWA9_9RHOB|nr:XRE family transcriptional regulator [Oceanomicrobium pacificus]MXU65848.1 helix-turn-helix domain-containing protein [Oceanomicrobium pacificus]
MPSSGPETPESDQEISVLRVARASGDDQLAAPINLGERVRALRKARNWTLEQAARKAGLARSTLSKIENEQMSPTFDAMRKLADGLDISIPQLFTPPKNDRVLARRAITRTGEGTALITKTYEHEILAADLSRKRMLPYRATVRARSFDEFDGWVRHDGEEFLYVLSGVVRFFSEFYEPVDLKRGDTAYYDAAMGHNLVSLSQEDAVILWVTSLVD